jgi:hypothetical protein
MTKHKVSPYSSQGGASIEGTPDTKFTSFSPEELKGSNSYAAAKTATTPLKSVHDPFFSTSTKAKVEQKLSATATSFQPFGLKYASPSSAKSMPSQASRSSAPIPGTAQHLQQIIEAEENSPRRRTQIEITQSGTFTTNTRAGRHIKISSIFLTDVSQVVQASMDVSCCLSYPYVAASDANLFRSTIAPTTSRTVLSDGSTLITLFTCASRTLPMPLRSTTQLTGITIIWLSSSFNPMSSAR